MLSHLNDITIKLSAIHNAIHYHHAIYHSLNGIPMGIGKFQPPTKSIPLNQSTKNSAQLITSARGPPIPNLVEIHSLGASGQMGEI